MKGHLLVEHAYPTDAKPTPRAVVDVNLVLETIKGEILENGRWINVIGYVRSGKERYDRRKKKADVSRKDMIQDVLVQAVLIWDAGIMRPQDYEKTMEAQREAWKTTRHVHEIVR